MASRQTLCRDYSNGVFPSMSVIRINGLHYLASVAERPSPQQVIFDRLVETAPRRWPRQACGDLQAYMSEQHKEERRRVLREAQAIVAAGSYVSLDTETTGLEDRDQIVSWAIVDPEGRIAGQGLVKPTVPISAAALATHGIDEEHLAQAPGFGEDWAAMEPLLAGKTVLVYGVDYDIRLLKRRFYDGAAFTQWDGEAPLTGQQIGDHL